MPESTDQPQVAVVTGAGGGMGQAIVRRLAGHGMRVVLVGRSRAGLEAIASQLADSGPEPLVLPLDVTRGQEVDQFKQSLEAGVSHVDVLVNCVGEAFIAPLEHTTEADFDRLVAVNLKGPFLVTRALLGLMRRSRKASIINIVSKVALKGYGTVTAYTAAKAGLLGFTRSLADELREDEIRVVALCPGPVDTPMRWAATPDYDRRLVIDPESIADTVHYLVQLPRGVTMGEILIESIHND